MTQTESEPATIPAPEPDKAGQTPDSVTDSGAEPQLPADPSANLGYLELLRSEPTGPDPEDDDATERVLSRIPFSAWDF